MSDKKVRLDSIVEGLDAIRAGEMLIVVDDQDRENEGDFIMAAEDVTPEAVNFISKYGRGLLCLSITSERARELELPQMVLHNTARLSTSFTVSVDAVEGTTTGISAQDRSKTIAVCVDENAKPADLERPGHIFPLEAHDGGVLQRAGHTEAVVDLCRLAGKKPAGVLCEIMDDDGSMARLPKLREIADEFNMKLISIADLIRYRRENEKLITREAVVEMPTRFGMFKMVAFSTTVDDAEHLALVKGEITEDKTVLVRVHSECMTGDLFHSLRCDCGEQLEAALAAIEKRGTGVLLYMRQEGRGIGLINKLKAYELQDEGYDTVDANRKLGFKDDLREYGIGAQILRELGVKKLDLMTNNPRKLVGLSGYGLTLVDRIPLVIKPNVKNARYLQTKKDRMGHIFDTEEGESNG